MLFRIAKWAGADAADTFDYYAGLADAYPFEEPALLAGCSVILKSSPEAPGEG